MSGWQFWIDRGGTFTDIVARNPDNKILIHKVLSENPEHYQDAAIQGIRELMDIPSTQPLPSEQIAVVKIGTTVATNALLEKKGDRTVLVITKGFKDALRIGYQNRPDLFALDIILPEMLYEQIIEVDERFNAQGEELQPVNPIQVEQDLQRAYDSGIRSCAIVLMHGYRYTQHEKLLAQIAQKVKFRQISVSHQISPLMKLVSRGDTTVVDAYLSPILRRYVDQLATQFAPTTQLMFMQSSGGLTDAKSFQGKDSILSGPAGGIVGAVKTSLMAGYDKIITFDMGGTSTDVAHYAGEYERVFHTEIAGVRLQSPMLSIHTVAAGGGSIIQFDGTRYRVGPESAGANPGPVCYGKNGFLTITDCNVMVGKLQPEFFPKIFGQTGDLPLNVEAVKAKFDELKAQINQTRTSAEIATGFIAIAVEKMANAIKKISLQKGYDVSEYTLCCFGGAGGQHACLIADALGIKEIFIHPYAGVLSAYGIGLSEIRILKEKAVEAELIEALLPSLESLFKQLIIEGKLELSQQQIDNPTDLDISRKLHLKYQGTDFPLIINYTADLAIIREEFEQIYHQHYGFVFTNKTLIVEALSIELICPTYQGKEPLLTPNNQQPPKPITIVKIYSANQWLDTPIFQRENLQPEHTIIGPALIIEATGTNVIELGWQGTITNRDHLILTRCKEGNRKGIKPDIKDYQKADPVLLEIFNNLFRSIAEQMGITLQNTSYSVNIKERLDFSCAIFDNQGQLVANAPHIPVHLGSMGESVQSLIKAKCECPKGHTKGERIYKRDVYLSNNPYNGGTHLPDLTVITPVFDHNSSQPLFYVASRGHHGDIGGITPGSMPPHSKNIIEEGILIDNFLLIKQGYLQEAELKALLTNHPYPVRNYGQNLADIQAQIAANNKGVEELLKMVNHYGLETVKAYMIHIQDNAEESIRKVITTLKDGNFSLTLDLGDKIEVNIKINPKKREATIDFTGTSKQGNHNFNAPSAVCKAAVLYVFRTLVKDDIPLNAGCLKPLEIIIPEGSLLNPQYPAAVVAGNVETSQNITDCLYGALGVLAASQGTMNNFTFGNEKYQYYETICGGSGAGKNFNGTDAVQTHMTNSRLTDPEVLEWRYPVLIEKFAIRDNSGGIGRYCGGNGVIRQIRFLEAMTASILSNRRVNPPFGLEGGKEGKKGHNYIQRNNSEIEELTSTASVEMNKNDVFIIETPGGGSFYI